MEEEDEKKELISKGDEEDEGKKKDQEILKKENAIPSIMETSYLIPLSVFTIFFLILKLVFKQSFFVSYVLGCICGWVGEVLRERSFFYSREKVETIVGVLVYTVPIVLLQKFYQVSMDVLFFPVTAYFKSRGLRIRKVQETPDMQRRKQTASVLLFMSLIPLVGVVWLTILYLCYTGSILSPFIVIYLVWALAIDKSHVTGSRAPSLRNSNRSPFRHFIDYFPITFARSDPSTPPPSADENYVFAYHPHGIIGLGAFGSFVRLLFCFVYFINSFLTFKKGGEWKNVFRSISRFRRTFVNTSYELSSSVFA